MTSRTHALRTRQSDLEDAMGNAVSLAALLNRYPDDLTQQGFGELAYLRVFSDGSGQRATVAPDDERLLCFLKLRQASQAFEGVESLLKALPEPSLSLRGG